MPRINGIKVVGKNKRNSKPSALARKQRRAQKAQLNIDPEAKKARRRELRKARAAGTEDEFYRKHAQPLARRQQEQQEKQKRKQKHPRHGGDNDGDGGGDGGGAGAGGAGRRGRQGAAAAAGAGMDADAGDSPPPAKQMKKLSKKQKRKLRAQQQPAQAQEDYFSIAQTVETEDGAVVDVEMDDAVFGDTSHAGTGAGDGGDSDEASSDGDGDDDADDAGVEDRYDAARRARGVQPEEEAAEGMQQKLPTKSAATGRMIPGQVVRRPAGTAAAAGAGALAAGHESPVGSPVDSGADDDDDDDDESGDSDGDDDDDDDESESDSDDEEVRAIMAKRKLVQARTAAKRDIAHFSQYILANPSKGLRPPRGSRSHMQELHRYTKTGDPAVICWALLSELAIFVDLLPMYRITLIGEHHQAGDKEGDRKRQLLSKEVRELRTFERNLLLAYETFLSVVKRYATQDTQQGKAKLQAQRQKQGKSLPFLGAGTPATGAAGATDTEVALGHTERLAAADKIRVVCVQCLLQLVLARPTFNHADELLSIAVALADGVHAGSRALAAAALVKMFLGREFDDPESKVACAAVKLVGQRIKKRGERVRPELFYCLNRLKLRVDMTEVRQHGKGKKKKNRKRRFKHQDEVEKELEEASARIKSEERHESHAEMLREVIVVYFRVLKEPQISRHLPIILRGLSRLAHLINIDIVADLVRELRRISQQCAVAAGHTHHGGLSGLGGGGAGSGASGIGANQPAATATVTALEGSALTLSAVDELLLLLTVFTTLEGPGEELKVDCTFFLERLHQLVLDLPVLCLAADEQRRAAEARKLVLGSDPTQVSVLHLMDQGSVAANVHGAKRWRGSHPVILMAQCLDMAYLRRQETNPQRSAIVCRRLMQVAAQVRGAHESLALITAARFIMQKYPKVAQLLGDAPEDGVFAAPGFPDDSGAQARPTAWHLVALRQHFHPHVRATAAATVRGKPAAPRDTAVVLFDRFDSSSGGFKPAPSATPPPGAKGFRPRSLEFARAGVTGFDDAVEVFEREAAAAAARAGWSWVAAAAEEEEEEAAAGGTGGRGSSRGGSGKASHGKAGR